jgi:ferritin-like metal-binding protein YciE
MAENDAVDVIRRYLEDAIAAEKSFETQLRGFSREGDNPMVQRLFAEHADETKFQYELLTRRLDALGGSPSMTKSFMAHMFNLTPKAATLGHDKEERTTQNLLMAYAVEHSEIGMYEALAAAADEAGDTETSRMARQIQQQERATADKVWGQIEVCAREAFHAVTNTHA